MESVRKRVPYAFSADGPSPNDGNEEVLDEQEQEDLIANLRAHSEATDRTTLIVLRVLIGLSGALHVLAFFIDGTDPMSNALNSDGDTSPIPLSRIFLLASLILHGALYLHVAPTRQPQMPFPVPPMPALLATSCLPALVALAGERTTSVIGWWLVTPGLIAIVWTILRSMSESKTGLAELENLKYDAKGA